MNHEAAFRTVYGRDAKPEETARFNRLAKELGIKDNDAIWSVVFLLGHHVELAGILPKQIGESAAQSLAQYEAMLRRRNDVAESELRAVKARVEETVTRAVIDSAEREIARSAQAVARSAAAKNWLQWLGGAAVCGMFLLAIAFYLGYRNGKNTGYAFALDVKEASSWAATPAGQAAYRMDRNGDLIHVIRCDESGWKVQRSRTGEKSCFVSPGPDGDVFGWNLP